MADVSPALNALYQGRRDEGLRLLPAEPDVFEAAAFGLEERLAELIRARPEAARAVAPDDFTPLHLAAFFGHPRAVRILLDAGALVDATASNSFLDRVQPLHSAAANGDLECCRLLLEAGADVDARQGGGFTPLMAAAQAGNAELVKLFLDAGADPRVVGADGTSAAALAEAGGHRAVLADLEGTPG